ncbi:uncharacterized protein LY89DRAFT_224690 [Mollisia scopiformis]|uniref:Uncharacterized protein n=1 Tax=Mollisia scopiformis TaxID=149040 RepID=A0A194WW61_MOLSC|nr:uncharacterized protein LY89DRAFT_224690 [Mollisia scopiformis]KUJ12208.1 hypothetical protein LY89DRAFT_224690 [Mollisia scopiformis]
MPFLDTVVASKPCPAAYVSSCYFMRSFLLPRTLHSFSPRIDLPLWVSREPYSRGLLFVQVSQVNGRRIWLLLSFLLLLTLLKLVSERSCIDSLPYCICDLLLLSV